MDSAEQLQLVVSLECPSVWQLQVQLVVWVLLGATGAAAGAAVAGPTGNNPGEDSGVAGATSVLVSAPCLTASG